VGTRSSAGRSNVSVTLRLAALLATTMNCGVEFAQGTVATPEAAAKPDQQAEITEIVVTAQRREQRLSDVPMSVQAYLGTAAASIGQSYGFLPRDYKRYGGIRLSYKF
jgi:outer membrane receptor protein involved in Fe transport